jgi:anti-anti-sigma factor
MSELWDGLRVSSYRTSSGDVVVRLAGALDSLSAPQLMDEVAAVDPRAGDRVVLHLADVTRLDSAGVGALFYLEAFVRVRRGRLVISMPGDHPAGINGLTLERHFSFVDEPAAPRAPRPTVPMYRPRIRSVPVKEEL